ncbi:MAG TPA: EpsI family protein [Povalibacter sp.]|nr:EpsI family protein [Povalibacter sp.]
MNLRRDAQTGTAALAAGNVSIPWQLIATVLALSAVVALLFWPTIESLQVEWRDTANLTYTHGYLIVAVCIWMAIRAGGAAPVATLPDWRIALLLVALSLCWLIVYRAGIELLHQALLPVLGFTALCAAVGARAGRRFWFAYACLYFAIPVWDVGNGLLQSLTVVAVRLMLQLTSVPAYVVGNFVHIPAGTFEIAGGCSGLHFFIVALSIAAIYGEMHRDSLKTRISLLALAAVLAVVSNWVRVYTIVVAGHLTDMQHYLVRVDHYYFGWALFILPMLAFFWLAGRIPVQEESGKADAASPSQPTPMRPMLLGAALAVVAAACGPVLGAASPLKSAPSLSGSLLPGLSGQWSGPYSSVGAWNPVYPGSDERQLGDYRRGGQIISAFVARYREQRQAKELIGYDNSLAGGLHEEVMETTTVDSPHGRFNRLFLGSNGTGTSIVLYYYKIGERRMTAPFAAQVQYGLSSVVAAPESLIVAVYAHCGADCAAAENEASQLLAELDAAPTTSASH